jgi:hypothetical protein
MTVTTIGSFNEANVSMEARRLAICFHRAADAPRDRSLVEEAKALFEGGLKGGETPSFNADEREFLKDQILEAAGHDASARYPTSREAVRAGQSCITAAQRMSLI